MHQPLAGMLLVLTIAAANAAPIRVPLGEPSPPTLPPATWKSIRVKLTMSGKRWQEVLAWLANRGGLTLRAECKVPAGNFVFHAPKDREYDLVEIFDIIHRSLPQEKYFLVRNGGMLIVLSVDQDLLPMHIPRVALADLPDRGETEIVETVVTIHANFNAGELAPDVRRFLGDLGRVAVIPGNRLLLRCDVATLRRWIPELPLNSP
ncbi:MAG: hypothetical protein HYR84_12085 [Planctomycetes bacterium]|nr:hypothetical protein [Planctomycetota bacterium]